MQRYRGIQAIIVMGLLGLASCAIRLPTSVNSDLQVGQQDLDTLLDAHTDSYVSPGSDMQLLTDGPESLVAYFDLIDSARHHLHIELLNFDNDTDKEENLSLEFAQKLADKAAAGVQVRIIIDDWWHPRSGGPFVDGIMTAAGVEIIYFNPVASASFEKLNYRQHKKILVADGRRALIGGINYGWLYFAENQWRDSNALLTGPVVAAIQEEFIRDWRDYGGQFNEPDAAYFPPLESTGTLNLRAIDQRPLVDDFDMNNAILLALRSAQQRVDIEVAYFNPTDWLIEELTAAADRGVEVRLLTNSAVSVDIPELYTVMSESYDILVDHGVRIYLWGLTRTFHAKAMAVDEDFALFSSHNMNYRSIVWDTENGVISTDPEVVQQVRAMIESDMATEGVFEIDRQWVNEVLANEIPTGLWLRWFKWMF